MALLFMDGFDDANLGKYSSTDGIAYYTTTRFGVGKCIGGNYNSAVRKAIPPSSKVIAGCAYNPNQPNGSCYENIVFYSSRSVGQACIRLLPTGSLELRRGDWQGALIATASMPLTGWNYIEMSVVLDDVAGNVEVRLNGNTIINYTGDTRNGDGTALLDFVMFRCTGTSGLSYIDDCYICDGTGTTNNTFLGDVRVQTLKPTGAGSSTQFTPTGGANYANVADMPDSTATYNASSTVGNRDTYAMADLAASTGPIYGVQNSMVAWKSDAGTGSLKTAIKSGASVYYDATQSLGTSPTSYVSSVREINPATSAAWTVSDVNGAELGMEVA